jgi:uncharacterized membrane protein (DUF485 family)
MKRFFLLLWFLLFQLVSFAQERPQVQMADLMRDNGKIYVVVAVILTIFAMIVIYLVRIDRKLSKIEKNIHS